MPKFTTKKRADRKPAEFDLDDITLIAQRPKSAVVLNMAKVLDSGTDVEQAGSMIDFVNSCLDKRSREHISARLLDPDDDFDFDDIQPIIEWLMAEYGSSEEATEARPTPPSSASPARRRSTGHRSTAGAPSTASNP